MAVGAKPAEVTTGFTLKTSAKVGKVYTLELPELLLRPNTSEAVHVLPYTLVPLAVTVTEGVPVNK